MYIKTVSDSFYLHGTWASKSPWSSELFKLFRKFLNVWFPLQGSLDFIRPSDRLGTQKRK